MVCRVQVQSCRYSALADDHAAFRVRSAPVALAGQLRNSQSLPVPRCMEDMYETLAIRLCDVAETQTPPRKYVLSFSSC